MPPQRFSRRRSAASRERASWSVRSATQESTPRCGQTTVRRSPATPWPSPDPNTGTAARRRIRPGARGRNGVGSRQPGLDSGSGADRREREAPWLEELLGRSEASSSVRLRCNSAGLVRSFEGDAPEFAWVGGEVVELELVVGAADHQREAPTRDGDRLIVGDAPRPRVDGDRDPSLLVPTQKVVPHQGLRLEDDRDGRKPAALLRGRWAPV